MNEAIFDEMVVLIIEQQEAIIGPIALERATQVPELHIDWPKHQVSIDGNPQVALNELVEQFKELFGQIAVETCKDAVSKLLVRLPVEQQPELLRS